MQKRTKIFFIVWQMLQKPKKTLKFFSPNLGHSWGEGGGRVGRPRWKLVTPSSVFCNPSLFSLRHLQTCLVIPAISNHYYSSHLYKFSAMFSHFQTFPGISRYSSYFQPFPAILHHLQPFQLFLTFPSHSQIFLVNSNHFQPCSAIPANVLPFPDVSGNFHQLTVMFSHFYQLPVLYI